MVDLVIDFLKKGTEQTNEKEFQTEESTPQKKA